MPKKETPEKLLTRQMGKDAADKLLVKIDKMIAKGESAEKIEKVAYDEIVKYIEQEVDTAIKVAIGPKVSVKLPPALTVNIQKVIRPQISSHKKVSAVISERTNVRTAPVIRGK